MKHQGINLLHFFRLLYVAYWPLGTKAIYNQLERERNIAVSNNRGIFKALPNIYGGLFVKLIQALCKTAHAFDKVLNMHPTGFRIKTQEWKNFPINANLSLTCFGKKLTEIWTSKDLSSSLFTWNFQTAWDFRFETDLKFRWFLLHFNFLK